jgi:hypothetical protein
MGIRTDNLSRELDGDAMQHHLAGPHHAEARQRADKLRGHCV